MRAAARSAAARSSSAPLMPAAARQIEDRIGIVTTTAPARHARPLCACRHAARVRKALRLCHCPSALAVETPVCHHRWKAHITVAADRREARVETRWVNQQSISKQITIMWQSYSQPEGSSRRDEVGQRRETEEMPPGSAAARIGSEWTAAASWQDPPPTSSHPPHAPHLAVSRPALPLPVPSSVCRFRGQSFRSSSLQ